MKIKIMSPLGVCLFTLLVFLSTHSYAEYYLVYPFPPPVIWLDGNGHHHVTKKKYPRHSTKRMVRRHSTDMSVYYISYAAPPCCICQEVWIQGRWDCYGGCAPKQQPEWVQYQTFNDDPYGYSYTRTAEITYDPDLTTKDDNTWKNPGMDIDE